MSDRVSGGSNSYYDIPPSAKDLLDLIDHKKMRYSIANIFKACYRFGEKPTATEEYDLEKIIYFAQRELAKIRRSKEDALKQASILSGSQVTKPTTVYEPNPFRFFKPLP